MNKQIECAQELLSRLQEILRDTAINALVRGRSYCARPIVSGNGEDMSYSLEKCRSEIFGSLDDDLSREALLYGDKAILFEIKDGTLREVLCPEDVGAPLRASIMEFHFLQESVIEDITELSQILIFRNLSKEFANLYFNLAELARVTCECVQQIIRHHDWKNESVDYFR